MKILNKSKSLIFLFFLYITLLNGKVCECNIAIKTIEVINDLGTVG